MLPLLHRLARPALTPLLALGILLTCAPGFAADTPASATLSIMNREVVQFRAPLLGASPQQRVARSEQALKEAVARGGKLELSVQPTPAGNSILLDKLLLFTLQPDDVDKLSGETLETLTTETLRRLEQIREENRESRNLELLLRGLAWVLGETAIYALILWFLLRSRRWVSTRLMRAAARQSEHLKIIPGELLQPRRLLDLLGKALAVPYWGAIALLAYTWLSTVLAQFPYTRAWGERLSDFLIGIVITLSQGILRAIPDLVIAACMFLIAHAVVRILRPFFDRIAAGSDSYSWLDAETVRPTRNIVTGIIWIFALVMAYPYLPGSNSEAFKGVSVLLGLMISLGASSVVGQAASGLILMYTRTLRRGEYVRIGEHEGTIVEMGIFNTRLRTGRGSEITLPNSLIVGHSTTNYSRTVKGTGFVIDTAVTIGYDTPWRQVEAMLIEAATRTNGILTEPRPAVFQTALSDFYPEYTLVCQAVPSAPRPRAEVLSELHANIQDVFNEYGVQIMSPHYLGDPASDKLVPPARWYAAPARQPEA
ncbi:mechanosensitive ion channel family protein [Uliginosibacterium sp. 31-12]|uniref:mechanosensitive ion channel family protein n=1 Tax=Uliginosibacterium sp. 31-12 TaxID=3062781 RepID=UPI0026E25FFB|nr:mechanosensitive ion channel family protein [Uliginosibacterium sp. 31-12]MDO6385976.1 mechanosensitive ion channel family protein [Uliginosibacterium sp. 31-12]